MANGDQSNEQQVQTMMRQQWKAILACQDEKKAFRLTIAGVRQVFLRVEAQVLCAIVSLY